MQNTGYWWSRLSATGVLAVLAASAVIGLRPAPDVALASRATAPVAEPLEVAAPVPGAILAPYAARQAVASRGDVAYALVGGALTLADIPSPALAAYQRAATVINTADDKCHLDWALVAALGKVLSDHGRADGSELDDQGVARPAVVGRRLTGRHGTQRVDDSDAGVLDRDPRFDRAVGPLQLLPAVWSVVGVDGDSNGRRNPQDVDDAALSAAVFLCAGPGDLRNASQRRSEIKRFHPGADYAKSVLGVRAAYLDAQALPTAVSVLVREEGVSVLPDPVAAAADSDDQAFSAGSSFEPGPERPPPRRRSSPRLRRPRRPAVAPPRPGTRAPARTRAPRSLPGPTTRPRPRPRPRVRMPQWIPRTARAPAHPPPHPPRPAPPCRPTPASRPARVRPTRRTPAPRRCSLRWSPASRCSGGAGAASAVLESQRRLRVISTGSISDR